MNTLPIIIDCDPGIDDALALLFALGAGMDVSAITTVAGNSTVEQVTANTLTVLQVAQRTEIPVHRGVGRPLSGDISPTSTSHGVNGLGGSGRTYSGDIPAFETAVDFLLESSQGASGPVTIAALGPLTNIASAVLRDPSFPSRVDHLVVMGGAIGKGNVTPAAEFNFWHDPVAADIVVRAGFARLDIIGLDVTGQVFLDAESRERIRYSGGPTSDFVYEMTREYFDAYWRSHGVVGAEMCDPLVIGHLLDPGLIEFTPAFVEIETTGISAGRSNVWSTDRYSDRPSNAHVGISVDSSRFFDRFLAEAFDISPSSKRSGMFDRGDP